MIMDYTTINPSSYSTDQCYCIATRAVARGAASILLATNGSDAASTTLDGTGLTLSLFNDGTT